MENRSGLVVDVETTQAIGKAEREAALTMVARTLKAGCTLVQTRQRLRHERLCAGLAQQQNHPACRGQEIRLGD